MTNWRESSSQMCSKHVAALAAAGLARGRRTAVLGRTACCSHTEFGSGLARLQSAYAWAGSTRWLPRRREKNIRKEFFFPPVTLCCHSKPNWNTQQVKTGWAPSEEKRKVSFCVCVFALTERRVWSLCLMMSCSCLSTVTFVCSSSSCCVVASAIHVR